MSAKLKTPAKEPKKRCILREMCSLSGKKISESYEKSKENTLGRCRLYRDDVLDRIADMHNAIDKTIEVYNVNDLIEGAHTQLPSLVSGSKDYVKGFVKGTADFFITLLIAPTALMHYFENIPTNRVETSIGDRVGYRSGIISGFFVLLGANLYQNIPDIPGTSIPLYAIPVATNAASVIYESLRPIYKRGKDFYNHAYENCQERMV